MTKTSKFCSIHQENTCKSSLPLNLIILTDFYSFDSEWRETPKLVNFSMYTIKVKIWQWPKLLNSFPFIKKTLVNHLYIWIWSFWLTFTALQWMKTNFKISQFPRFLLRSGDALFVRIWKWLKLLNSFPLIKKTLVNQVYIQIWSFWLTFTVSQWMKKNSKISQFPSFLLRFGYAI